MPSRRKFLSGLLAVGACPLPTWADAGDPDFLSAARKPDGTYALYGLSAQGQIVFEIPLPGRGHAAAAHPFQPYAVAFARRPGTFALVIDCREGRVERRLEAEAGRHFYGHGVFSTDGNLLFTTENDYESAEGRIGVWDVRRGFRRIGEFASGGVGPHDVKLLPDSTTLVVANGGIETHPDSGRTKLNLPTMRSNLSYMSIDGSLLDKVELENDLRLASIRHLAVRGDGLVAAGCQWQGQNQNVPLIFTHRRGSDPVPTPQSPHQIDVQGYVGSIAFSRDGKTLAATSPRANVALLCDLETGTFQSFSHEDICGVASARVGLTFTTGQGQFLQTKDGIPSHGATAPLAWDNHLVSI